MNRKYFGIFIIVISVLLLFLIVYFVWFYDWGGQAVQEAKQEVTQTTQEQTTQTIPPSENTIKVEQTRPPEKRELNQEDLKKMAGSFAERFGSYSNHSNYGNISDLKIFMTEHMQEWADNFIEDNRGEYNGIYYGITTKAITKEVQSYSSATGKAKILVQTQRKESTGNMGNERVFYQDVIIDFIKEDGAWKVNSAVWQD